MSTTLYELRKFARETREFAELTNNPLSQKRAELLERAVREMEAAKKVNA